jgi:hypothetical protein
VSATAPEGLNDERYPYWSGYITVNGTDDSALSIPYQGLSGSLYEAQLVERFTLTDWISWPEPMPANASYVLPYPGEDYEWAQPEPNFPLLNLAVAWGSKYLTVYVVPSGPTPPDATAPTPGGEGAIGDLIFFPFIYVTRGLSGEVGWYGELADGTYAGPGSYHFVFAAQRLMSDGSKEDDWEIIKTVDFNISYLPPRCDSHSNSTASAAPIPSATAEPSF